MSNSVTDWIHLLKQGDKEAAQPLWERYFGRLVTLARRRLPAAARRAADEEDVALSAFDSFCRGAECGRFPRLDDRDNLWRILVNLTTRKAGRLVRAESRQKRGGAAARAEADLAGVAGNEPTPEFAAQFLEEYRRRLDGLDPSLRAVALAKMDGCTNEEIVSRLDLTRRTVERKLGAIRALWTKETEP